MNKLLTIVIMSGSAATAALDNLLQQLRPQVEEFLDDIRVIVQADETNEEIFQLLRAYSFVELVPVAFENNRQRHLMTAYSYKETDYIWALPHDAQVANNLLARIMPFLKEPLKSVVVLNRQWRPLPIPITENWQYDRLGAAAALSGFFDTFMHPACVVIPEGVLLENWPTYTANEAQVYAYMRQFKTTPVNVIGEYLVFRCGAVAPMENAVRARQWIRMLCTALIQNDVEGTDDIETLRGVTERASLFGLHDMSTFNALFHWLDSLWKFRWPLDGVALIAAYRVMRRLAKTNDYLTPINRAAELCPGSEGLFHGHLAKQPFWVSDLVVQSQSSDVQWVSQTNAAAPAHPLGESLSLPGVTGLELTQQEIGELNGYLLHHKVTFGAVVGTVLGTAAATVATAMQQVSPDSRCYAIPTEPQPDAVTGSAKQLATLLGLSDTALQFMKPAETIETLGFDAAAISGVETEQLQCVFIDGLNRPLDYVLTVLKEFMPHMSPGGHVFLRNNPFHPLLEQKTRELYNAKFEWLPHCGRPFGYGVAVMRVPAQ